MDNRQRRVCYLCFALAWFYGAGISRGAELGTIVVKKSGRLSSESRFLNPMGFNPGGVLSPSDAGGFLPLYLQPRPPLQSDFSLRGSNFQGVAVLFNGQPINDPQTGHFNCDIPLTCDDLERIEVIPGGASSLFGPGTIGGAVNIRVKRPDTKIRKFQFSLGSDSFLNNSLSIASSLTADSALRVSVQNSCSDGFSYDTDYKTNVYSLSLAGYIPDGEWDAFAGYGEKEFGAFDLYTPGSGYPSKEWTKTLLLASGVSLDLDETMRLVPRLIWRRHYDKFVLDKTFQRSQFLSRHTSDVYDLDACLKKQDLSGSSWALGVSGGGEAIVSTVLGDRGRRHFAAYANTALRLRDNLNLETSFRTDYYSGGDDFYSAGCSLGWMLSEAARVTVGGSHNIRLPTFTELYYNDPVTSGNPDLSAEQALTGQLSYNYKTSGVRSRAVFFVSRQYHLIEWAKKYPGQAKWLAYNLPAADVFGFEQGIEWLFGRNLDLRWDYVFTAKRAGAGSYLLKYGPNYAPHLASLGLGFELFDYSGVLGLHFTKKPHRRGWLIAKAAVTKDIGKGRQFVINLDNILNVEYQHTEGINQPGRTFEAGLRMEW